MPPAAPPSPHDAEPVAPPDPTADSDTLAAARARFFVALDVADSARALALVDNLGDTVSHYKVGLELLFGGGLDLARTLKARGKIVFLDLKLLDIANTVERAVANAANLGVDYLTLHASDRQTLDAAVRGRGDSGLALLAVTVMTNLARADLDDQGISETRSIEDLVTHRAALARAAGVDGVVASGLEARKLRDASGAAFHIVTPGIRFADDARGDQVRVMTPERAIAAGASHLVIGRPITTAHDPQAAATRFTQAIADALQKR
ncbi:MAG: orotidine-5'-phosphate decarboxylase [Pseudomonadota bacterium]